MAKSKFYAVRKGRHTGIFYTWDECKDQIQGFSGAVYKSFPTEEEAQTYMNESVGESPYKQYIPYTKEQFEKLSLSEPNRMFAFVDGSCLGEERYGAGAITFYKGNVSEYSIEGTDDTVKSMRNVAGELLAAMTVVDAAIYEGASEVVIYYDYAGIEEWASGSWSTKVEGTRDYAQFMKNMSPLVKVSFCKVSGHTGVPMNEVADQLAKKSLGITG